MSELEEWKHNATFSSREANRARCILERRDPSITSAIVRDSGVSAQAVERVLEAAQKQHTYWPQDKPVL